LLERQLAHHIGPLARHLVKRAALSAGLRALIQRLAREIDADAPRRQFLDACRPGCAARALSDPASQTAQAAAVGPCPWWSAWSATATWSRLTTDLWRARRGAVRAPACRYPATPLRVISALAEGADRLVRRRCRAAAT
jgi:hypothetical protein